MKPLTPRQAEVLELIKANMNETGMPPTRAEIAQKLGFKSANAAEEHLKALAKKGVIEIMPGTSRGIRLLLEEEEAQPEESGLPLIGKVAAGEPILAQEHIESHYQVDPALFHPRADFLLRVQGMSMKNIGIMDGDLLAVHKTQEVRNGQVVVARLDEDVTVKRFQRKGSQVWLLPENEELSPIEVDHPQRRLDVSIRHGEGPPAGGPVIWALLPGRQPVLPFVAPTAFPAANSPATDSAFRIYPLIRLAQSWPGLPHDDACAAPAGWADVQGCITVWTVREEGRVVCNGTTRTVSTRRWLACLPMAVTLVGVAC